MDVANDKYFFNFYQLLIINYQSIRRSIIATNVHNHKEKVTNIKKNNVLLVFAGVCVYFCGYCYACYLSTRLGESCCIPIVAGVLPLRIKLRMMLGIRVSTLCIEVNNCLRNYCLQTNHVATMLHLSFI